MRSSPATRSPLVRSRKITERHFGECGRLNLGYGFPQFWEGVGCVDASVELLLEPLTIEILETGSPVDFNQTKLHEK